MNDNPTHRQLYIDLERAGAAMSSAVFSLVNSCATPSSGTLLHLDGLRRNWDLACGRMQQAEHLTGTVSYDDLATENAALKHGQAATPAVQTSQDEPSEDVDSARDAALLIQSRIRDEQGNYSRWLEWTQTETDEFDRKGWAIDSDGGGGSTREWRVWSLTSLYGPDVVRALRSQPSAAPASPAIPAQGRSDKFRTYVEDWAAKAGWVKGDAEGAFEFAQRKCYRQGWDDARDPERGSLRPVHPVALQASIAVLNEYLRGAGDEILTPSQGESIYLVLNELKRLMTGAAQGQAQSDERELAHKAAFQRDLHRAADIYEAVNGRLLRKIVEGDVGRQTLHKLSTGQGTETDDGRVWLAAKAAIDDRAAQEQAVIGVPPLPEDMDIAEQIALNSIDSPEFVELIGAHAAAPSMDTAWAILQYADKRMHAIIAKRFALAASPPAPPAALGLTDAEIYALADAQAIDSMENGNRVFDRGGVIQLGRDIASHLASMSADASGAKEGA